jgi:LemA protein
MGVWVGVVVGLLALTAVAGLLVMRLRSVQAAVDDSWQQVLLALRRQRGLAAELADAVRIGSRGEIDLVDRIRDANAVADLPGASPGQPSMADQDLEMALTELTEAVEASPRLLADAHVSKLRTRLGDADRRVDARRAVYEQSAAALRRRTASFPDQWVARALGIDTSDDDE